MRNCLFLFFFCCTNAAASTQFRQGLHLLDETSSRIQVYATLAGEPDSDRSELYKLETPDKGNLKIHSRKGLEETRIAGLISSLSDQVESWSFDEDNRFLSLRSFAPVLRKARTILSLPMAQGINTVYLEKDTVQRMQKLIRQRLKRGHDKLNIRANEFIRLHPNADRATFERFLLSYARPMHLYSDFDGNPTSVYEGYLFDLINYFFPTVD